jgi:hypothetical protein
VFTVLPGVAVPSSVRITIVPEFVTRDCPRGDRGSLSAAVDYQDLGSPRGSQAYHIVLAEPIF